MSKAVPLALGRRRGALAVASVLVVTLLIAAVPPSAGASRTAPTSLVLQSQSTDVVGEGTFVLGLHVASPIAPSALALQVRLYSKLSNRTYFDYSLSGSELPSESCLSETTDLPLAGLSGGATDGSLELALPVSAVEQSPRCSGTGSSLMLGCVADTCPGVYPVQVTLVDPSRGRILAQFTTHLIELAPGAIEHRLQVGLVLSLGAQAALTPSGTSALSSSTIVRLGAEIGVLAAHHGVRLTVAAYGQLLAALAKSGSAGATALRNLDTFMRQRWRSHNVEPIGTPFAPLDASALASTHLAETLTDLLRVGEEQLTTNFGRPPALNPFVVPTALDGSGNGLLAGQCVHELLLPSDTPISTTNGLTQTAPLLVSPSAPCQQSLGGASYTVAFVADPAGSLLQASGTDAVLRAHQFIAALAQIYFEQPNAAPRAVVVEPSGLLDPTLLGTVLSALSGNPILQPATLGALFATIGVGAANDARTLTLPATTPGARALPAAAIAEAHHTLLEVASLVPSDHALVGSLTQALELGESAAVGASRRNDYLSAPTRSLGDLAASFSFLGSGSVTLTSPTGDIPITIHQVGNVGPIEVTVRLLSSELVFPKSVFSVGPFQHDTQVQNAKVETRGSGTSHLYVELLTPLGGHLLLRGTYTVHSRAISGVAVAISLVALAVLLAWWLRSLRSRRRARRAPAAP